MKEHIKRLIDRLRREDVNLYGFILSQKGKEIAEAYYAPFREGKPHRMYSVSKTLTGIAVGMLAEDGKLSLDQPIVDFFSDYLPENPDGRLLRQTIRDMLRMATCYRSTAYQEYVDTDWAKPFFTAVPTHEPGTVFHYDTGASQVLAALVRRVSGQEVIDFLEERLFTPLGLRDERYWLRDPSGCCTGGTGLCMSLRDLHRIAQCLLDGGEGLVPAWYVEEMQRKQIDTLQQANDEEKYGYGWQCWRTRAGWSMYGMGGQLAIVCPQKQAILTTIADTRLDPMGVQKIYNAFFEEIYPFLSAKLPAPMVFRPKIAPLPNAHGFERSESARYSFTQENPLGIKWLQLHEGNLLYENARGEITLFLECGKVQRACYPGVSSEPALICAGWADDGLLRIRCHAIGESPCGFDMLIRFREKDVTVQSRRSYDPLTHGYEGVATGYAE